MHASIILKVLGSLLMLFSLLANLPPIIVSLIYDDGMYQDFLSSMFIIFSLGSVLFFPRQVTRKNLERGMAS